MKRQLPLILCCLLLGALWSAPIAQASFGLSDFAWSVEEAPASLAEPEATGLPDTQAGSHPYEMQTHFHLNTTTNGAGETIPDGSVKDIEVELPAGLTGNASELPQCPEQLFAQSSLFTQGCPASTQIGTTTLETTLSTVTVPIYNLVPPPGDAARFGAFALLLPVIMDASVRGGGDYGLTVSLLNSSQLLPLLGGSLNFWGVPADPRHDTERGSCLGIEGSSGESCPSDVPPKPFLTLGSSCIATPHATMSVDSWEDPGAFDSREAANREALGNPVGLIGCGRLDFSPAIEVRPETTAADSPSGFSIDMQLPQNDNPRGLGEAALQNAVITLPAGVSINPAAADGLSACQADQFPLQSPSNPSCPAASKLGSVEIDTPLLPDPIVGSVFLAQPGANPFGGPLAIYLSAEADGVLVKLAAQLTADPVTGQLTLSLSDSPQLPISELEVKFDGGPRAPLATPASCATLTTSSLLSSYAQPASNVSPTAVSSFAIDHGCSSFAPSFLAGATSTQAGRSTSFVAQLARTDGQPALEGVSLDLPPGLLANLSSVPPCAAALAATGRCQAASEIGSATIAAGAGSHPYYLQGAIFLTGSYDGAPFGLSIAIPAQAGPFDLGAVVVRARVAIDSTNGHMTIDTDAFPTILAGIPLRVKLIQLTIDRPEFMFNPTNCGQREVTAIVAGAGDAAAPRSSAFGLTGCSSLPFSPQFSLSTRANISRSGGAALTATIRFANSTHSNLRSISLGFPRKFSPRLAAIQASCPAATFENNPASCPTSSAVGSATVLTPMLAGGLQGPVYLISRGSKGLPRLALLLQGQGVKLLINGALSISRAGVVSASFDAIPDAPIASLQLSFPSGSHSIIGANSLSTPRGGLCGKKLQAQVASTAQNGRRVARTVRLSVTGCRRAAVAAVALDTVRSSR